MGSDSDSNSNQAPGGLGARLAELGRRVGEREAEHATARETAARAADELHARVSRALAQFHASAAEAGAPHIEIALEAPRVDDKHLRAVEFGLARGRHRAIVTVKSRGAVTLVGPFQAGKAEGPCRTIRLVDADEIESGLADFLERFLEQAVSP